MEKMATKETEQGFRFFIDLIFSSGARKDASERPMQKRHHPENAVFTGLYGQKVTTLISYQNQRCWVVEHTGFEPVTSTMRM